VVHARMIYGLLPNLFMKHWFLVFEDMCVLHGNTYKFRIRETTNNSNLLTVCLKQSVSEYTLNASLTWVSSRG
jgi:hypothetical protein